MYGFIITISEVNLISLIIIMVLVSLRGLCLLFLLQGILILILLNFVIRNPSLDWEATIRLAA